MVQVAILLCDTSFPVTVSRNEFRHMNSSKILLYIKLTNNYAFNYQEMKKNQQVQTCENDGIPLSQYLSIRWVLSEEEEDQSQLIKNFPSLCGPWNRRRCRNLLSNPSHDQRTNWQTLQGESCPGHNRTEYISYRHWDTTIDKLQRRIIWSHGVIIPSVEGRDFVLIRRQEAPNRIIGEIDEEFD